MSKLSSLFRLLFKLPPPMENVHFMERDYKLFEGTIRVKPDKDDGWILACAKDAKRIFDIGANIGQATIIELYPTNVEQVVLVDPNPYALSMAAQNMIYSNMIQKCRFYCAFVNSEADKEIEFYTIGHGAAGSMYKTHAKTASKYHLHFMVNTTTVDYLCGIWGIPDFMKIDVEGAETNVLKGAANCFEHRSTRCLIEVHASKELPMKENAHRILSICHDIGYKAWYLSQKEEWISEEQVKNRGRFHALIQPEEWEWPEWTKQIDEYSGITAR